MEKVTEFMGRVSWPTVIAAMILIIVVDTFVLDRMGK